jgi:inosose dehydratase
MVGVHKALERVIRVTMKIGCFAAVEPFAGVERQFAAIREMGFDFADLTDNHNGGMLGVEYGFTPSVSLDAHPHRIRDFVQKSGITLTSVCAHANLLDPQSPDVYGTTEIIKAIRLAALLGIRQVITTEGEPKTRFGQSLTAEQRIFSICSKLCVPLQWAEELGIELLLEPHGIVTGSLQGMYSILERLDHHASLGICLDTGNSWLGGVDPLEYIERFGNLIKHIHWKDMSSEWLAQRGSIFGCGMSSIALGDGLVGIPAIVQALSRIGFAGETTLEIAGKDNIKSSRQRLEAWVAEAQPASLTLPEVGR